MRVFGALLILCCIATSASAQRNIVVTGEIADSSCAYNVHSLTRSHKEMLKSKKWGKDAADCSRRCVRMYGASYVVVRGNDVFKLVQQNMAEPYAGKKVEISGSLAADGETIHIDKIEPVK